MSHDDELQDLMQALAKKSLALMADIQKNPTYLQDLLQQYIELVEHFQEMVNVMLHHPEQVMQMQFSYMQDAMNLMQTQFQHWVEGKSMPIGDRRFSEELWLQNPFFNLLGQHYLLACEHLNQLLESIETEDPDTMKRLRFFSNQYLDALSPANFVYTNPQIMAETIESQGKNLLKGLHNFLSDIESGSNRLIIKMTDMDAFQIGQNIATSEGKVIYRNDLMELIQYSPKTDQVKSIPLLIIPPWINKYYILDLSPKNSLVRFLTKQGITVFMISWVNPESAHADKAFYDYLHEGPETAVKIIKEQLAVEQINTLGFCIGGTLLASFLAYQKARKDNSIKSATFLATMIDFSEPGDISVYIDEKQIEKIDSEMKKKGYLAGQFMASTFNSLRANDLVWSFFIKNYLQGKNPMPFDVLYWNGDCTNMPQTMMSQYLRWMYLQNDLIKPGKIKLNKKALKIQDIDTPAFFVATMKDHIAPWTSVYKGFKAFKGPKHFVLGGSGHIVGIINPPASEKYQYYVNDKMPEEAQAWLEQAKEHSGSWWNHWLDWLKHHSGKQAAAPSFSKLKYKELEDAPGKYVLKKST